MKLPGVLHLEGQIQSLIKSSEKELGGCVSAFLRAHHSTIQADLAALAQRNHQQDESSGTLGDNWNNDNTPNSSNHHYQGPGPIRQVTVNAQIHLHCSNRGVWECLVFIWHLPVQGQGVPCPRLCVPLNRLEHAEHTDLWESSGAPRGVQQHEKMARALYITTIWDGNKGKAPEGDQERTGCPWITQQCHAAVPGHAQSDALSCSQAWLQHPGAGTD